MLDFTGQNVVITGGTRGIGKGIAKAFLERGATVFATYAGNDQAAEAMKTELGELAEKLYLEKFNVANYQECEAFFKKLTEKEINIQVLINNAGIRKDALLATMKEEQWDQVMDINLKGTFNMSKLAVLNFLSQRYGRIVNISSIAGSIGLPGQANYSASKAGQVAFSKSLSKEVAKRNITINNIAPGFIETELISDLPENQVKEYKAQVPMKRFGTTDEIAAATLFLASKEASYITGSTLEVSGGL
jgi:3-oxoacyl-[acyl-carrier protein] reductase